MQWAPIYQLEYQACTCLRNYVDMRCPCCLTYQQSFVDVDALLQPLPHRLGPLGALAPCGPAALARSGGLLQLWSPLTVACASAAACQPAHTKASNLHIATTPLHQRAPPNSPSHLPGPPGASWRRGRSHPPHHPALHRFPPPPHPRCPPRHPARRRPLHRQQQCRPAAAACAAPG